MNDLYTLADSFWDAKTGWNLAHLEGQKDITPYEVIDLLVYVADHFEEDEYQRIKRSVQIAFTDIRFNTGAFPQRGRESYARTAFFLLKVMNAVCTFPQLLDDLAWIRERIIQSAYWLSLQEKAWAGNQSIF